MFLQDRVDKNVQGIRDRWLVFNIIALMYPIIAHVLLVLLGFRQSFHLPIVIAVNLMIFTPLYYFAYRKPGTRWLTSMMFMKLWGTIVMLDLSYKASVTLPEPQILSDGLSVIDSFVVTGWMFLNFQLRRVNLNEQALYKASQKEKVSAGPATRKKSVKNILLVILVVVVFVSLELFYFSDSVAVYGMAYKMGGLAARSVALLVLLYPVWKRTPWRTMTKLRKGFLCFSLSVLIFSSYKLTQTKIVGNESRLFYQGLSKIDSNLALSDNNFEKFSIEKHGRKAPLLALINEFYIFSSREGTRLEEAFKNVDFENLLRPSYLCDEEHIQKSLSALEILKKEIDENEMRRDPHKKKIDAEIDLYAEQLKGEEKEFLKLFHRGFHDSQVVLNEFYNIEREIIIEEQNILNFLASKHGSYVYEGDLLFFEEDIDVEIFNSYFESICELGNRESEIVKKLEDLRSIGRYMMGVPAAII